MGTECIDLTFVAIIIDRFMTYAVTILGKISSDTKFMIPSANPESKRFTFLNTKKK